VTGTVRIHWQVKNKAAATFKSIGSKITHWQIRAAIQRRGYILAWTVILSVYGADTIAIDLSLSALIS
jgi:hypothetical protein